VQFAWLLGDFFVCINKVLIGYFLCVFKSIAIIGVLWLVGNEVLLKNLHSGTHYDSFVIGFKL
jgi:hypothetical protein